MIAAADGCTLAMALPDETATAALAARLAGMALPGDTIALWGGLGVGKTVFARGFVRARGRPDEDVPSPTFTLVQAYDPAPGGTGTVYHFDLFRIEAPDDALELGIEDAFADGIALIEWPDRLGHLLPSVRLDVRLDIADDAGTRRADILGTGDWPARLESAGLA